MEVPQPKIKRDLRDEYVGGTSTILLCIILGGGLRRTSRREFGKKKEGEGKKWVCCVLRSLPPSGTLCNRGLDRSSRKRGERGGGKSLEELSPIVPFCFLLREREKEEREKKKGGGRKKIVVRTKRKGKKGRHDAALPIRPFAAANHKKKKNGTIDRALPFYWRPAVPEEKLGEKKRKKRETNPPRATRCKLCVRRVHEASTAVRVTQERRGRELATITEPRPRGPEKKRKEKKGDSSDIHD